MFEETTATIARLRARWAEQYDERPGCPHGCVGGRTWHDGRRGRSATLRMDEASVFVPDASQRRKSCSVCGRGWTHRPEGIASRAHYQPCVVSRALGELGSEPDASTVTVAEEIGCAPSTVRRWVERIAALAEPAAIASAIVQEADEPIVPPVPTELAAPQRSARSRALLLRAVAVLMLLEALASLRGLVPPAKLRIDGRLRQTYLIAFLDDATRLIPHATFALSEGTTAYLPALEHAIRRRGIPKRLYVDNGAAFRSQHLALVCAKLGIALIHATPRSPQGKGKMERWFRTVRMQLMPTLDSAAPLSIDVMNRRLAAWVEGEYHRAPHRGLGGATPMDRWARTSEHVRMPGSDAGECFLFDAKRRVARDRTVTLDGVAFEVDAALVGQAVTLRYDPARAPHKRAIEVWHAGKRVEIARRLDALSNCFVRRNKTRDSIEIAGEQTSEIPEGLAMRDLGDDDLTRIF